MKISLIYKNINISQWRSLLMEELLKKRAKNKLVVDLRHLSMLSEVRPFMEELSPLVGYFCLSSSMLASNSLIAVMLHAKMSKSRIILDLNLNCSPEQMVSWAKQLQYSGVAMVTVQCSAGPQSLRAFMETLKENEKCFSEDCQPAEDSFSGVPRPLVIGVTIPYYLEQVLATPIFGNTAQCSRVLNGYVQKHLEGIVCTPSNLKSCHNSDFCNVFRLVTNVVPKGFSSNIQIKTISPIDAIEDGADYLLIREPIVSPPAGYSTKSEVERMLVEIVHAIQIKERLKKVPSTKKMPYTTQFTRKKITTAA